MALLQQRAERQRFPVAQSMPAPVSMAFARFSRNRWMVR